MRTRIKIHIIDSFRFTEQSMKMMKNRKRKEITFYCCKQIIAIERAMLSALYLMHVKEFFFPKRFALSSITFSVIFHSWHVVSLHFVLIIIWAAIRTLKIFKKN